MSKLYRIKTLSQELDMGVSTIWKMVAEGKFPKPIKLGVKHTAWLSEDIQVWLDNLKDE